MTATVNSHTVKSACFAREACSVSRSRISQAFLGAFVTPA